MKGNLKKILIPVIIVVICLAGWLFFNSTYTVINGTVYPRSAAQVVVSGDELPDLQKLAELKEMNVLDVREVSVQPEQFEQLRAALPECDILWKVPFGAGIHDNTAQEVAVTSLTDADLENLKYFSDLKTVDAQGCSDYDVLLALKEMKPELDVMYSVNISGNQIRENTTQLKLHEGGEAQLLSVLAYLPDLQTVDASECSDYKTLAEIYKARPSMDVQYAVPVGGVQQPGTSTQIEVENVDIVDLTSKLPYFPCLTDVTLSGQLPDNESIYDMVCAFPDVTFHWNFEVLGVETSSTATTLILSDIKMKNTDEVEKHLKYFYNLERVEMCGCGISSEEMDALWKRHPETRFVWSIQVGYGYIRTDATNFIPFRVGRHINRPLRDYEMTEFKYLIDMVCLDLGHMRMEDLSFLEYMPKLRFLIIADAVAIDYTPIGNLTELVYLELFMSKIKDLSILTNLKKLECLNIGWTRPNNPEVLKEMTWLTHLWANNIGISEQEVTELKEALPNTVVYISPDKNEGSTSGGWRKTDRYYEMRDLLGMYYMD